MWLWKMRMLARINKIVQYCIRKLISNDFGNNVNMMWCPLLHPQLPHYEGPPYCQL